MVEPGDGGCCSARFLEAGVYGRDNRRNRRSRLLPENADGFLRRFVRRVPVSQSIRDKHCGSAAFGDLSPCVAADLFAMFSDRNGAPVQAPPVSLAAACVKHSKHGGPISGRRRNLEDIAQPSQRSEPVAWTACGGEAVATGCRQVRNPVALIEREDLHGVAGAGLDQARDQNPVRCVLEEVCRKFGRDEGDPPRVRFAETGPFSDTDALTPCFGDMARVLNGQFQLHPISSGLSKRASPDRQSIQW